MRSKLISLAFTQAVGGVYLNSFMTVLHSRYSTYNASQIGSFDLGRDSDPTGGELFSVALRNLNGVQSTGKKPNAFTIHITKETHTVIDEGDHVGIAESDSENVILPSTPVACPK
ncbi:hypothetical protein SCHPADRAFT_379184 [Schizopora paradoxa]|uniref:Uncharacterized protein n=1 Tax=Schizopora paradoxa TaxID=27342 RepID=A0A0H2S8D6_9AGAM|nr:hypothetical protein SCHPADRAFT_379184 [Schizopora paradoxa]